MASWNDLKRTDAKPDTEPDEYAMLCVQVLDTPAGRELMKNLRRKYFDKVSPGIPDSSVLLSEHAKRQVVRDLEDQIARGLAFLAREKTSPDASPSPPPTVSARLRR